MPFGFTGLLLLFQLYSQTPDACMVPTTTADTGHQVNVNTGQVFAVVLDSNPGTGYSWSIASDPDPTVAVALDNLPLPPATSLLGAPGRQCFRFNATGAGHTSVGFNYARPFEPDAPPAQSIDVQVTVSMPDVPVQLPAR
jgi:inhibitor of cysteine peptidase